VVQCFRDTVREQRRRLIGGKAGVPNELCGFLLEQPMTQRAREHLAIQQLEKPARCGGDDAIRLDVDNCQLGAPIKKGLHIWASRLDAVRASLQTPTGERIFKCHGVSSNHKHLPVRGRALQTTPFTKELASYLAIGINKSFSF
jgi:hypothetical protein